MNNANIASGEELPVLVKVVTQERINLFEATGVNGEGRVNFHTDPEAALRSIGLATPLASGRMQISYVAEAIRRFAAAASLIDSRVNLKFIRPVTDGDTVSVRGRVLETTFEDGAQRVSFEVWCENQRNECTSFGTASALLKSEALSQEPGR